jgi:hydroxyversicolorone monooxygenase
VISLNICSSAPIRCIPRAELIENSLQPDWPKFFSYSPDIWSYLDKVCDVFGLRKYMHFRHEVIGCYWQEDSNEWLVKLRVTNPDGSVAREFEDRCHVLLDGTGILNNFKWPNIEGLRDKYKGKVNFATPPTRRGHWLHPV